MRLERWAVIACGLRPYDAPELAASVLCGSVYGHPEIKDGTHIKTSSIVRVDGDAVITRSGSRYELGDVDAKYEAAFPGARERVLGKVVAA